MAFERQDIKKGEEMVKEEEKKKRGKKDRESSMRESERILREERENIYLYSLIISQDLMAGKKKKKKPKKTIQWLKNKQTARQKPILFKKLLNTCYAYPIDCFLTLNYLKSSTNNGNGTQ